MADHMITLGLKGGNLSIQRDEYNNETYNNDKITDHNFRPNAESVFLSHVVPSPYASFAKASIAYSAANCISWTTHVWQFFAYLI